MADRVAIVTGAGQGLGRSHALALAADGVAVVVNDVGDPTPVVEEIQAAGGEAIGNTDGVDTWEGGQAIVETAIKTWGRLDAVVNNAGILRDSSFQKMTPDQVAAVLAVHLGGSFHVTHAAWPHLKERGGSVVMTASGSGIYGNFGQANYGSAKMGLVGLTRVLSIEGKKAGIRVNAIAPLARTQMTEELLPEEILAKLDPSWVSPMVTWLVREDCPESGHIFSVAGGRYARIAIVEGPGATFDQVPTADDLAAAHDRIATIDGYTEPQNLTDQITLAAGPAS